METQLRELIKQHNFEKAKNLVLLGIDVNETNSVGGTALMASVLENSAEMTEFLLSNGAYVNMCNNFQFSALNIAYKTDNAKISALLRKYGAINPFDETEKKAFITDFQSTKKQFLNFFKSKNLLKNICGYNLILINDVAKKYLIKNRKKIQRYAKAEPIIMWSSTAINSSFFSILAKYMNTADSNTYILEEKMKPDKLNTNSVDLSAEEVKKMASELLENWE